MNPNVSAEELRSILKSAMIEVLEERRDLLRDIVEEAMEDLALGRAMQEAEPEGLTDRAAIFNILDARQ